jgi:hypothetical protein
MWRKIMNEQIQLNYELLEIMERWVKREIKLNLYEHIHIFNSKEKIELKTEIYTHIAIWTDLFYNDYVYESQNNINYKKIFTILDFYFFSIKKRLNNYYRRYLQKTIDIWSDMKIELLRIIYIRQHDDISELNQRICGKFSHPCVFCDLNYCNKCCAFCDKTSCEKSFASFAAEADKQ